jgi:hypothetical protein
MGTKLICNGTKIRSSLHTNEMYSFVEECFSFPKYPGSQHLSRGFFSAGEGESFLFYSTLEIMAERWRGSL